MVCWLCVKKGCRRKSAKNVFCKTTLCKVMSYARSYSTVYDETSEERQGGLNHYDNLHHSFSDFHHFFLAPFFVVLFFVDRHICTLFGIQYGYEY